MRKIKPYKLKRKIWLISTVVLAVYSICLIINPTVWTALLPVIIPTTILTVGIPAYAVTKHMKSMLETETLNYSNTQSKIENTNKKENIITKNEDINKKINNHLELQYEPIINKEGKQKVKTKGTRY